MATVAELATAPHQLAKATATRHERRMAAARAQGGIPITGRSDPCDRFMHRSEVISVTGLSDTTLWREYRAARFPKPYPLTKNRVGWLESEVRAWMATRCAGGALGGDMMWGVLSGFIGLREQRTNAPPIDAMPTSRATEEVGSDSATPCSGQACAKPESKPHRRRPRGLQHHSPREHALLLVRWLQRNVDLTAGFIFHDELLEHYTEAVIEAGWAERSWNPVGRHLALICTGGRKQYQWAIVKGQKKRRRYYPIPAALTEVAPIGATSARRAA